MLFDAHFHYPVCLDNNVFDIDTSSLSSYKALSCSHSLSEWKKQKNSHKNIYHSFGIHPQLLFSLSNEELDNYKSFLIEQCENKTLNAIGEAGFDLFTEEFKSTKEKQNEVFYFEIQLCIKYQLPLVIHCRKANDMLFKYSKELKKIPSVLFHSFMGSLTEANSLIKRGINCFFSFGKQMLNNNKKVIDCTINLPLNNLLLETDAPFQTLKNEKYTTASDIKRVYKASFELRKQNSTFNLSYEEYESEIYNNALHFLPSLKDKE